VKAPQTKRTGPDPKEALRAELVNCGCSPGQAEAVVDLVERLKAVRPEGTQDAGISAANLRAELKIYQKALQKVSEMAERFRDGHDPLERAIRERTKRPEIAPLDVLDVPSDAPQLTEIAPSASLALASDAVARMLKAIPTRLPSAYKADRVVRSIALTLHRSSENYHGEDFLDFELLRSEGPNENLKRNPNWVNTHPDSAFMAVVQVVFGALGETGNPRHAVSVMRRKAEKLREVRRRLEAADAALVQAGVTLPTNQIGDKGAR
jgi:hypothetical protein